MTAPKIDSLPKIAWSDLQQGELLGNGSYGDVYRGKWNGKEVAIKLLLLKKLSDPLLADFDNETRIMASCQSERIVHLFGVCLDAGHYGMIMEYMPKGSLYQLLQDSNVELPWGLRFRLALEIGEGLNYLHHKEILHRDLKSLNILLDANNHPKISDFGLSKIKLETSSTSTTTKQAVGTVRWQAPELFKRKAVHSKASDIYSYGMLLWEIASRKIPFSDAPNETTAALWIQQGEKEEIPSDCPDAYSDLIKRSWSQEPKERPLIDILLTALRSAMPAEALSIPEKAWHIDASSKKPLLDKKYELLPASPKDFQKVLEFYAHHPMPGYEIASVQVIHNPSFNRGFELHMAKLQERHQNPAFKPDWSWESHPEWRKKINELFETLAKPYTDPDYPNVKLLPLWHGTKPEILDSIFRVGFANLAATDAGFFGKGLYSAFEAEYAQRVYGQGALLLNWVAIYSAYPAIDGDMGKLAEKANYQNYDAHFVPVIPKTSNPHESNYFPTKPSQKHTYTEVVVFESAACLPRYLVQLQPNLPKQLPSSSSAPLSSKPATYPKIEFPKSSTSITKPSAAPQIAPKPTLSKKLPDSAFGKAKWEQYFGDIGAEPALPANIEEILNNPCPFWPGKKVSETHLLVLIPQTVNGRPLTLNSLNELIQKPKQGPATQYRYYWDAVKKEHGNTAAAAAHWVLMTRDLLPETRNKSYAQQKAQLESYAEKAQISYEVPQVLEAAVAMCMHHVATGERLYSDSPWTNTRCQEMTSCCQQVVGGFAAAGLVVGNSFYSFWYYGYAGVGLAALRKFF